MILSRVFLAGFLLLLLIPTNSSGEQQAGELELEIVHLLDFISHSGCTFIRNGESHTGPEARKHIQKKYAYLKKRIDSTENFIKYAASRSSMSRKDYKVQCGDKIILSRDWLLGELEKYRQGQAFDYPAKVD